MQSKATTAAQYLAELPEDRKAAISAVRAVILKNLDTAGGYVEGMQYGMITYAVSKEVYPAGYHCNPKLPVPYVSLASQKNHMALYMMCFWGNTPARERFDKAWAKTGKKLEAGVGCIRFKKLDDLALDVIGDTIKKTPVKVFMKHYESLVPAKGSAKPAKAAKATKKAAPKRAKTTRR